MCSAKVDRDPVYDLVWMDDTRLATVGKRHVKLWTFNKNSINAIKGVWGKVEAEPVISCHFVESNLFTGTSKGKIISWAGNSISGVTEAHKGIVYVLKYNEHTKELLSGGQDGLVKVWTVKGSSISNPRVLYDSNSVESLSPGYQSD
jgi:WD40 repeat protein